MQTETITLEVDAEAARAFNAVSAEDQRRLAALISLRLIEATKTTDSLEQVMREISRKAQERGLTPEILRLLLDEG